MTGGNATDTDTNGSDEALGEFSLSVVIATYDRPQMTTEAIQSLKASFEAFRDTTDVKTTFEVLLCCCRDDNQTLDRVEQLEWPAVSTVRTTWRATTYNRHQGIQQADGEYIAIIDSDCIVATDWVKSVLAVLNEKNLPEVIQGAYYYDYRPERTWYTHVEAGEDRSRFDSRQMDSRNIIIDRSIYFEMGGYDITHTYAEAAQDLALRRQFEDVSANITFSNEVVVYHRYPPGLWDNLIRYNRYGKGAILLRKYDKTAYANHSPRQFVGSTAERIKQYLASNTDYSFRFVGYRVLKTIAFLIGFIQGMVILVLEEYGVLGYRSASERHQESNDG